MLSPGFVRTAIGILGNLISFSLFLSPLPTFIRICKKGSVEQYSSTTYLVTLLNCMLWALYGLPFIHPNSILLLTISAIGCFIELAYLLLFVIYSDTKRKKVILILTTLAEILTVGIIFSLDLTLAHTTTHRAQIIGVFGDISGVVMYASPLSVMKQVITTRSVEFMPLAVSVASLANALVWTLYAIHPFDLYVVVPNGLGCFLGLAQLILYATYCKSTKEQLAARKAAAEKGEVGLKEVILVTVEPNQVNTLKQNDDSTPKPNCT